MGAPAVAASALAKTRTGRRVLIGVVLVPILGGALLLAPLIALPLAIANTSAATDATAGGEVALHPEAIGEWGYPLAGRYNTGRGFGWHPVKSCAYCPSDHKGYDMDQPCGATVYAAGPGRVITAGALPGWGNTVRIDHGGGVVTLYGHLAWGSERVRLGDEVAAGTAVGAEGSTGKSTGCHLHFEAQVDGVAIDPEPFMAARGLPLR